MSLYDVKCPWCYCNLLEERRVPGSRGTKMHYTCKHCGCVFTVDVNIIEEGRSEEEEE